jgi:unsaturated chondroitin disaccharide hydrolase
MKKYFFCFFATCTLFITSTSFAQGFDEEKALNYCVDKVNRAITHLTGYNSLPRTIATGNLQWEGRNYKDWTSGFWPGVLWYTYEYTKDEKWKRTADSFSNTLKPLAYSKANDHDLGFQIFCSYGNGYRLTKNENYKQIILATADTLATLFNKKVGTILSWPHNGIKNNWPHNTIIDNMMNLELLFWAARNGGRKALYDIAVSHANTTMQNHFRKDHSSYHVIIYDTVTGKKIKGITAQGYSDNSMWARGQAWGIYGFTLCYRETKNKTYLNFAEKITDIFLKKLPADGIPYWDFDAPAIPNEPKDAAAAAITASALLELSGFVKNKTQAAYYRSKAEQILTKLSSAEYQDKNNDAFLLHSTGHKPAGWEIDVPMIYTDYYYLEALMRLNELKNRTVK